MSVINTLLRGGGFTGALLLILLSASRGEAASTGTSLAVEGSEQSTAAESLVHVQIRNEFSGLVHEDKFIAHSRVIETSDFCGVVLDARGYVVFYAGDHGLKLIDSRAQIWIRRGDSSPVPAQLVGIDERISLAVLKANGLAHCAVTLGSSLELEEVDLAVWFDGTWAGFPFEVLRVSEPGIPAERELRVRPKRESTFLGQEGSPVLDRSGRLLGIVTQTNRADFSKSTQAFRVVPTSVLRDSLSEILLRKGNIRAGWLGILLDADTPDVRISEVLKSSPAEASGLVAGDTIQKVNGQSIQGKPEFVRVIRWSGPESSVKLTVQRGGSVQLVTPVLAEPPTSRAYSLAWALEMPRVWKSGSDVPTTEGLKLYPVPMPPIGRLGISVDPLTPQLAEYFRSPTKGGLLVTSIGPNTVASQFGLLAGDVLIKINGLELSSPTDMNRVLESAEKGILNITFVRQGSLMMRRVVLP